MKKNKSYRGLVKTPNACDSDSEDESPSTDWFICRTCNKNFPGKRQLWLHKRTAHSTQLQPKPSDSSPSYSAPAPIKIPISVPNVTKFRFTTKTKTKTTTTTSTSISTLTSTTSTVDLINIDDDDDGKDIDISSGKEKYSQGKEQRIGEGNPSQGSLVSNNRCTDQQVQSKTPTVGATSGGSHSQQLSRREEERVESHVSVIHWSTSAHQIEQKERNQQSESQPSDAKRRKIELICLSSDSENEEELEEIQKQTQVSVIRENQNESQDESQNEIQDERQDEIQNESQSSMEDQESNLEESQELEEPKQTFKLPIGTAAVSPIPIPQVYTSSPWLSETEPQRFPYFPQMGDELVYFRQGHEQYIHHMEKIESDPAKFYKIERWMKSSLPYVQNPNLPAEISVRVVGIKYELLPPRLVRLKLVRTDWRTGAISEDFIIVTYQDVDTVVDFLVLRQMYDKSLYKQWQVGQKFRSILEKKWWLGTILEIRPVSQQFPNSNFLKYLVEWDSGKEHESLSPWDMEKIPDDSDNLQGDGVPATEKELKNNVYTVEKGDWEPEGAQDEECSRISNLIQELIDQNSPEVAPFAFPVDTEKFPAYTFTIPYPIDLSTIKTRLDNRFYRRIDAVETDLEELVKNTRKFNGKDAEIVQWAENLKRFLFSHFKKSKLRNVQRRHRSF